MVGNLYPKRILGMARGMGIIHTSTNSPEKTQTYPRNIKTDRLVYYYCLIDKSPCHLFLEISIEIGAAQMDQQQYSNVPCTFNHSVDHVRLVL